MERHTGDNKAVQSRALSNRSHLEDYTYPHDVHVQATIAGRASVHERIADPAYSEFPAEWNHEQLYKLSIIPPGVSVISQSKRFQKPGWNGATRHHEWECPPRSTVDRSAYRLLRSTG